MLGLIAIPVLQGALLRDLELQYRTSAGRFCFFVFLFFFLTCLSWGLNRILSLYFLQRRKFLTSGCLSQLFQFSRPRGDSAVTAVSPAPTVPYSSSDESGYKGKNLLTGIDRDIFGWLTLNNCSITSCWALYCTCTRIGARKRPLLKVRLKYGVWGISLPDVVKSYRSIWRLCPAVVTS